MDLNHEYIRIPQEVKDSLISTSERVRLLGTVKKRDIEILFGDKITEAGLSGEKALHTALLNPSGPLERLSNILYRYIPNYR